MLPISFGPFTRMLTDAPRKSLSTSELGVALWTRISNGVLELFPGVSRAFAGVVLTEPVLHIEAHISSAGQHYLCIHTKTGFFVWDGTNFSDRARAGGYSASTDAWSSCSFGDLYVFGNGIDATQTWDANTPTVAAVDDTNIPKAAVYRSFASYVIAACITDVGDPAADRLMRWCAAGDPTNWTTGDSGSLYVYEAEGAINDIQPLTRDTLTVYKDLSTHNLSMQSFPFTFVATSMISGTGVASRRGVARFQNTHICLTNSGLAIWDGVNYIPFAQEIHEQVQLYNNNPNSAKHIVYYLPMRNELWVLFAATSGYCENGFVLNMVSKSWTRLSGLKISALSSDAAPTVAVTWDNIQGTWDSQKLTWDTINATVDEALYVAYNDGSSNYVCRATKGRPVYTFDEAPITAQAETGAINPAAVLWERPYNRSELVSMYVDIVLGSPQFYVGVTPTGIGKSDVVWHGPFTADSDSKIDTTIEGRYFLFKVVSSSPFSVAQITPYFVLRGVV